MQRERFLALSVNTLQNQSRDTEGARDMRIFIWLQQIIHNLMFF